MPTYLSPGVYVEEVQSGSRPIEGVGTAVAAFVGLAAKGPFNEPRLLTNWGQFTSTFGEFVDGSYLAHAVYGYFLNGGGAAYVVRVGADGASPVASAEVPAAEGGKPAFRVLALEGGAAGNDLSVELPDPIDVSVFCLGGLGLERPRAWHEAVDARLAMSGDDGRSILRRLIKESTDSTR